MAKSSAGTSALARAVQLLDTFDAGTRDLTASAIAHRADMPLSTAHRIIGELVALGLLEHAGPRRYRIGLRLWELAVRTPGALGIREIALDYLRAAHARIGQHVQLGVLQDREVLYLERLSAASATVNFTVVGGRLPFHATSSGHVLIAHADPATQERVLAEPLVRYGPAPRPAVADLRRELAAVRAQGYAITRGYIAAEATAIAVPVHGASGGVVAAVSAIVPTDDTRETQVLSILRPTAAAIGKALRQRADGVVTLSARTAETGESRAAAPRG